MWKYAIILSIGAGIFGLGYYIYDSTTTTIRTLTEQNIQFRAAADQNRQELDRMIEDIRQIAIESDNVSNEFQQADAVVTRLRRLLSDHDLGELAVERPTMIQTRINNSTEELNRCFEILSGSPLTMEELNATKPSEINNSCSDIANPNYRN